MSTKSQIVHTFSRTVFNLKCQGLTYLQIGQLFGFSSNRIRYRIIHEANRIIRKLNEQVRDE